MPAPRSLMSECAALTTVLSFCSSSKKHFCKERSVNTERTREKDSSWFLLPSWFLHVMLFSIHIQTRPIAQPLSAGPTRAVSAEPLSSTVSSNVGVFKNCLRSQNANSKPGLGLAFQKVPWIALILLSVIMLH